MASAADQTFKLSSIPETVSEPLSVREDFDMFGMLKSFQEDTAAGPSGSGLLAKHLINATRYPPTPTTNCSLLRSTVNLMASEKVPFLCF